MTHLKRAIGGMLAALAVASFIPSDAKAAKLSAGGQFGLPSTHAPSMHAPSMLVPSMHPNFHPSVRPHFSQSVKPNFHPGMHPNFQPGSHPQFHSQNFVNMHPHRHHRHHGGLAIYSFYPYYYPYYNDVYYGDDCYWLKVRALRTGSRYWWNRYYECLDQ